MSLESFDSSLVSLESEDFVLIQEKGEKKNLQTLDQLSVTESMEDTKFNSKNLDLRGLNPDEINVIGNIKKLAKENEVLKSSLLRHNALIQVYCDELEKLQKQQKLEKETTKNVIDKLEKENKQLNTFMQCHTLQTNLQAHSISELEIKQHILPLMEEITVKIGNIQKMGNCSNEKSLGYPTQESQQAALESISHCFERLQFSLRECVMSDQEIVGGGVKLANSQDSVINDLKADLSERMQDTENLNVLRTKFTEIQDLNKNLETENEKCKRLIRQLQQKIDQLEVEQPSVEIMQVASPQQTRMIESLKQDLEKTKKEMGQLLNEKQEHESTIRALNKACTKMSQEVSLQSKADGKEISEMRNSYEIAIEGLKDEISLEKQKNAEMSIALQGKELEADSIKEITMLKRTLDMMRKRENKDLDKMNKLVIERNKFKEDCEGQLVIIQDLTEKLESQKPTAATGKSGISLEEEQYEFVSDQDAVSKLEKVIEELQRQLSADAETKSVLQKQVSDLETELAENVQQCRNCFQLEEDKRVLSLQKNDLLDRFEEMSLAEEQLANEKELNQNLRRETSKLQSINATMASDSKSYMQQQLVDRDTIRDLREKLATFNEKWSAEKNEMLEFKGIAEEYRQRNRVLEANLDKAKKDLTIVWTNFQAKSNQMSKMEEQIRHRVEESESLSLQLEEMRNMRVNMINDFEKQLAAKDACIKKINEEVETMEIFREQVRVYENDFNIEREAREKQHSDILILRDDVHHLKLENHRLREEVEGTQRYQMAELQRRYGVGSSTGGARSGFSQDLPGLYGRGAAVQDNMDRYQTSQSFRGSVEAALQEPDQNVQRLCPKCHAPFPDLDTLQIHVLECLDE